MREYGGSVLHFTHSTSMTSFGLCRIDHLKGLGFDRDLAEIGGVEREMEYPAGLPCPSVAAWLHEANNKNTDHWQGRLQRNGNVGTI